MATCMRQVEFVDQPDQTCLGTAQGGLSWSSIITGLEAHPKYLGSLVNIPFPRTVRSMQSFLESLNYHSRFIKEFAMYASVLYELREADLHEIRRMEKMELPTPNEMRVDDRKSRGDIDPDRIGVTGGGLTADDRKGQGDSDSDRIGVTGGYPEFSCVTGGDLNSTDRSRWRKR